MRSFPVRQQYATPLAAYKSGYSTGLNWRYNYTPGGPWYAKDRPWDRDEVKQYNAESKLRHDEWLRGFNEGLAMKAQMKEVML